MTDAKIVPHLWFDHEAVEAATFYASVFPRSEVEHVGKLPGTPSGDCDVVAFHIHGQPFLAISAGPLFTRNPSVSFIVNFDPGRMQDAAGSLEQVWARLSERGTVRMPLGAYPFSKRYGWVEDRYGVSWQLILTDPSGEERPFVVPSLLFCGKAAGQAEKAIEHYVQVFGDARRGATVRYPEGMGPDRAGTLMFADFRLGDTWLAAMDSARMHGFGFNEAISLLVQCEDQAELDRLWAGLSADPASEQCGWLKDRFGVSWQVAPRELQRMVRQGTPEQVAALVQAFLPMRKLDVATLRRAFEQARPLPGQRHA